MAHTSDTDAVNYFLVSWDEQGVEHIEDITKYHPDEWAKQCLFDAIKTNKVEDNPINQTVTSISLRARFNPQRFYECYVFTATKGITFDEIKQWTEENPQSFADFVRKNHTLKVFDHRTSAHNNRVIS